MLVLFILILTVSSTEKLEKENEEFFNFNFLTNLQANFRVFFFSFQNCIFIYLTKLVIRLNKKKQSHIHSICWGRYVIQPPVSHQC